MTLKFAQIEDSTPDWAFFLVQLFPIAPILVVTNWFIIAFLLNNLSGMIGLATASLPSWPKDVADDLTATVALCWQASPWELSPPPSFLAYAQADAGSFYQACFF